MYNPDDDLLYVLFDGNWIATNIKAYAQSVNWFLNGTVNNSDIFGSPILYSASGSTVNSSTYRSDGYLLMQYNTSSGNAGNTNIFSSLPVPVGVYSSITVKFIQTGCFQDGVTVYYFNIGFTTYNGSFCTHSTGYFRYLQANGINSTELQTATYDMTQYNENGVGMYLAFYGITIVRIYEITFNK